MANAPEVKRQVLDLFSNARIELMLEVNKHEELCQMLHACGSNEWPEQLAEITAYCNIMMDGMYMPADLEILYPQLKYKLYKKRSPLILANDVTPIITKDFKDY